MPNDFFNTVLGPAGLLIGVLSAGFAFVNRGRYKTLITDIYEPGNKELRAQIADERQRTSELEKVGAAQAVQLVERANQIKQLEKLVTRLPDFADLTTKLTELSAQGNANHTEVIKQITALTTLIATQKGGQRGKTTKRASKG